MIATAPQIQTDPAAQAAHRPPVLFIPGALTGAWIWEDNFARFFEDAGYQVSTMSFQAHTLPFLQRNQLGFSDYLQECIDQIKAFAEPPIVIAHSMGGLIAQHAATQVDIAAMVLLSPVPAHGVIASLFQLGRRSPLSLLKFAGVTIDGRIARYASPPIGVYSESCVDERARFVTERLRGESLPLMANLLKPPKLGKLRLAPEKILFMAAEGDYVIPASEVRKAADKMGSPFIRYEGLSHTFQAEKDWQTIAKDMLAFLTLDEV